MLASGGDDTHAHAEQHAAHASAHTSPANKLSAAHTPRQTSPASTAAAAVAGSPPLIHLQAHPKSSLPAAAYPAHSGPVAVSSRLAAASLRAAAEAEVQHGQAAPMQRKPAHSTTAPTARMRTDESKAQPESSSATAANAMSDIRPAASATLPAPPSTSTSAAASSLPAAAASAVPHSLAPAAPASIASSAAGFPVPSASQQRAVASGVSAADAALVHALAQPAMDDDLSSTSSSDAEYPEAKPLAAPANAGGGTARKHPALSGPGTGVDAPPLPLLPAAVASAAAAAHDSSPVYHLPLSLRLSSLRLTPLHPHLLLFPSHKNDVHYQSSTVPASERQTSFETAGDLAAYGCPVMMNTPDARLNAGEADEDVSAVLRPFQRPPAVSVPPPMPRRSPSSSLVPSASPLDDSADPEPEPLGSPPSFLLASQDDEFEEGVARSGFVQCAKCRKWRTVPPPFDSTRLSSSWTCDRASAWDPKIARCSAPEELFDEGELWPGMPKRFTRLVEHYAFYRKLVALLHKSAGSGAGGDDSDSSESSSASHPALPEELSRFPTIRRRPLELHRMYASVLALGGFDAVSASNQWRTVQSVLRIPDQFDSSHTLKRMYRKLLREYEARYWKNPRAASSQQQQQAAKGGESGSAATNLRNARAPSKQSSVAAAAAADALASRKRSLGKSARGSAAGGADESDEEEDTRHSKRARRSAAPMNPDEYGDGTDMRDEEEAEGAPSLSGGVAAALRQLQSFIESRFSALESRVESRLSRMESGLSRLLSASSSSAVSAQLESAEATQRASMRSLRKEMSRKQDALARGLNMLLAERLKAALPRVALARARRSAREEEKVREARASAAAAAPAAGMTPVTSAAEGAYVAQLVSPSAAASLSTPASAPTPTRSLLSAGAPVASASALSAARQLVQAYERSSAKDTSTAAAAGGAATATPPRSDVPMRPAGATTTTAHATAAAAPLSTPPQPAAVATPATATAPKPVAPAAASAPLPSSPPRAATVPAAAAPGGSGSSSAALPFASSPLLLPVSPDFSALAPPSKLSDDAAMADADEPWQRFMR